MQPTPKEYNHQVASHQLQTSFFEVRDDGSVDRYSVRVVSSGFYFLGSDCCNEILDRSGCHTGEHRAVIFGRSKSSRFWASNKLSSAESSTKESSGNPLSYLTIGSGTPITI